MANLISEAIADISGAASQPTAGSDGASPVESQERSDVAYAYESTVDSEQPNESDESSNTPEAPVAGKPADASSSQKNVKPEQKVADKEFITVSDDKGKRKIEIDYADRAAIKKAFEFAHGARKWQAERDHSRNELKQLQEQYGSVRSTMDALEKAFAEGGEMGVIDLIAGKQGASEEFVKRQVARANFLETAKPHEIEALQQRERLEKLERDLAKKEQADREREQRVVSEREQAELNNLQASVNPVFEKYRFDGQLGDEADEDLFDRMLWNTTMERLRPYEEQGVELSRELIDKEFGTVAMQLRKRLNVQAEKKAANVVEQKKKEAIENVQASTMSAYKSGGASKEASDLIGKGDFASLFRNWGKYGASFNKK